ncbi:MAG: hypothetical protein ACLGH8_02310 [Bacteroidia bacterium]
MKKYILILIIYTMLIGCKSYVYTYAEGGYSVSKERETEILKRYNATETDYSLLYIKTDFESRPVKIYNDDEILLDKKLEKDLVLGISDILRVPRYKDITINDGKSKIKLSAKKLLSYKYIYLSKNNRFDKKYTVMLSNTMYGLR